MKPRVLIIDDEPEWQETLKDLFIYAGCDADAVGDINGAKELLKSNTYKLVVLDIFLSPTQVPLDYQAFLAFIARTHPELIVVAATGKQLAPDEAFELRPLGVADFIYKPRAGLDKIRQIVHRILNPDETSAVPGGTLNQRLDRIESLLADGLQTLNASIAEINGLTRAVIKLASADVTDCPRLFTLAKAPGKRASRVARVDYVLTLWCEYPGAEHAWDAATYHFSRPKEWLRRIAPYGLLVARVLNAVIPIAASLPGVILRTEDLQRVQNQLELMKEIAAQLPGVTSSASAADATVDRLTAEEGAGLRALHALLVAEDRARVFGDLRKVGTESGEIVWVCRAHEALLRAI